MSGNETVLGVSYTSTEDEFRQVDRSKRLSKKRPKTPGSTPPRANKLPSMSANSSTGSPSYVTPNPFASLSNDDCEGERISPGAKPEKPPSIPPIFVKNVVNMNSLLKDLKGPNPGPFTNKIMNNEVKFNFNTVEGYRIFITYLTNNRVEFHTFQLKSERSFRVVIRGLHLSCDVPSMMDELKTLGYDLIQMLPVRHSVTKR